MRIVSHMNCITVQAALPGESLELSLPSSGCESEIIVKRLVDREKKNVQVAHGHSTVSGTVYMQGEQMRSIQILIHLKVPVTQSLLLCDI